MVPAENKAKRLSSVNHTTKTIHHHNRQLVEYFDAYLHNQLHLNFIPHFFFCNLVILGTLGMPGYGHQKRWYQLVENFNVHHCSRNYIYPSPLLIYY